MRTLTVELSGGAARSAVEVERETEIPEAVAALGLRGRPVCVVIGGAGGLEDAAGLDPLFRDVVAPSIERAAAVAIDGATDSGVMRLLGRARRDAGASFPLLGVAAAGTVSLDAAVDGGRGLEPNHTHFVLVPGDRWGDESPWIDLIAEAVADGRPSLTLLVNGGDVSRDDVHRSLERARPVLVVAGTGRLADELAQEIWAHAPDVRRWAEAGLLRSIDPREDAGGLAAAMQSSLAGGA